MTDPAPELRPRLIAGHEDADSRDLGLDEVSRQIIERYQGDEQRLMLEHWARLCQR